MTDSEEQPGSITHAELISHTDQFIDQTLERFRKADAPLWEHETHMGRTLITLAGGGIIASVSVVQFLAEKIPDLSWLWLLPSSWLLWTICILAAVSRELWIGRARRFASVFERSRGALRIKLQQLRPSDTIAAYEKLVEDAFTEAEKEPAEAQKVYGALNQVVYWTFAGGILGLVIFAIKNLPF